MHLVGHRSQVADRDGAKAQVHTEVARAFHGGEVACLVVALDALHEIFKQAVRAAGARGQRQLRQVGGLETDVGERGHRLGPGGRHWAERARVLRHGVGLEVKRRERLEPGVFVGREHAKRVAHLCEHLAPLEDHVVFVAVQQDAGVRQGAQHLRVARFGLRLVVVVGKHRLHGELLRQRGHRLDRLAMHHDQTHAFHTVLAAQGAQGVVEFHQRFANEFHAPVGPGKQVEDVGVEHEHTPNLPADLERVEERGVVIGAQIAAKPHQAFVVGVHGSGRVVLGKWRRPPLRWMALALCWGRSSGLKSADAS